MILLDIGNKKWQNVIDNKRNVIKYKEIFRQFHRSLEEQGVMRRSNIKWGYDGMVVFRMFMLLRLSLQFYFFGRSFVDTEGGISYSFLVQIYEDEKLFHKG